MELKGYQKQVLSDLQNYIDTLRDNQDSLSGAYNTYWKHHPRLPLTPTKGEGVEPYKNVVKGVPHVCVKVPTAGGKTFIACNALRTIFTGLGQQHHQLVVWLVPSITILEQTIRNLANPQHPYRQRIETDFGGRLEVFDKQQALQGARFSLTTLKENLCILVASFDSFRTTNKEGRKVYQDNGNLASFSTLVEPNGNGEIGLMDVLRALHPVVVVDESHNAESKLSVDMLNDLQPKFILDLTATPRLNSNIISFVDSIELKKENMVKLPVIVSNQPSKNDVITAALQLQRRLEQEAKAAGSPIRPIVLFQAQPRTGDENTTFDKIKKTLLELSIPKEQIKIKTADRNELKDTDLSASNCPVRYIITVNALKEGWDCPNAYILASLADKNSQVDVEQILGRVLRLPYVTRNKNAALNSSYVLTSSAKFLDTLQNIVHGLENAGFSAKDYRKVEPQEAEATTPATQNSGTPASLASLFGNSNEDNSHQTDKDTHEQEDELDATKIAFNASEETQATTTTAPNGCAEAGQNANPVDEILKKSTEEQQRIDQQIKEQEQQHTSNIPTQVSNQVKKYRLKDTFAEEAAQLHLPQFVRNVPQSAIFDFGDETGLELLEPEMLLKDFDLSKCDTDIKFQQKGDNMYKVDLDDTSTDHTACFRQVNDEVHEYFATYLKDPAKRPQRIQNGVHFITQSIGNMYPIPDKQITDYVTRIVSDFTEEQLMDLIDRKEYYASELKRKITALSAIHCEKQFDKELDTDKITMRARYQLPKEITPQGTAKSIAKSLYEREGSINGFEEEVINAVANMENVRFWTRNIEKRGFCINGFINHYPDFIILTKKGKTVLLETKGDHLDAEKKIKLGNLWQSKAGSAFRYYLVYNTRNVEGAKTLSEFLEIMKEL